MSRLDNYEFCEWMAYYSIEPFGETSTDARNALLCSLLANIWRGKGQRAFKMEDFLLIREPKKKKTWKELQAILMRTCKGKLNGTDK